MQLFDVPADAYKFYTDNGVDILKLIDLDDVGQYYVDVVKSYFARDGLKNMLGSIFGTKSMLTARIRQSATVVSQSGFRLFEMERRTSQPIHKSHRQTAEMENFRSLNCTKWKNFAS